jgi:hypothetical protein
MKNVWEIVNEDLSYNFELVRWLFSRILSYVTWKLISVCRIWRVLSVLSVSVPYNLRVLQELAWLSYEWDAIPRPLMSLHWRFFMYTSLCGPLLLLSWDINPQSPPTLHFHHSFSKQQGCMRTYTCQLATLHLSAPEEGGSLFLWNIGIIAHDHMA